MSEKQITIIVKCACVTFVRFDLKNEDEAQALNFWSDNMKLDKVYNKSQNLRQVDLFSPVNS